MNEQLTAEVLAELREVHGLANLKCECDGYHFCQPCVDKVRLRDLLQTYAKALISAAEREKVQQKRIAELEGALQSALLIIENEGRNKNLLIREGAGNDLLRWANELRAEVWMQALKGGAK